MKPIKLEIQGLNSFIEKQTIDFSCLLQEGIFGIFGSTGSGKSTILDAITLALYGKPQKSKTIKDFVNVKSEKAVISFVFEILSAGVRRIYEFNREFFASDKKTGTACVYEIKGDQKFMLTEKIDDTNKKALEIIGLEFEDFKKCIALPQGEFDKFSKATKKERLDIIARLFSLEKYGERLYASVSEKVNVLDKQSAQIKAELSAYEEYTEEKKLWLENEIASAKKILDENGQLLLTKKKEFESLEKIAVAIDEERKAKLIYEQLLAKKDQIEEKKQALFMTDYAEKLLVLFEENEKCLKGTEKAENLYKQSQSEVNEIVKELNEYKGNWQRQTEEKSSQIIEKKAQLESVKDVYDEIKLLNAEIEQKRLRYKNLLEQKLQSETQLEKLQTSLKLIEEEIKENQTSETALIASVKNRVISDEYTFLKGENEKNGKAGWLEKIIDDKLCEASKQTGELSVSQISENLKKTNELKEKQSALQNDVNTILLNLSVISEKLSTLSEEGKTLKANLDRQTEKVNRVTGNKDYENLVKKVDEEFVSLNREKAEKEERVNFLTEKERQLTAEKVGFLKDIETFKNKFSENTEKINEISRECGIIDKIGPVRLALSEIQKETYKESIENYEKDLAVAKANYTEKHKLTEGKVLDADYLNELGEEINVLQGACSLSEKSKAVNENNLETLKNKLLKKNALLDNQKATDGRLDVTKKLQTLVKGRAFLAYVAEEYLGEISFDASKTLENLTSGRYSLVYKDDFFVIDRINNGVERPINTLSGGEVFLVSLSLAFSLSKAIYSKSVKPIEFFFLDEGFGTLDEELVETVMSSLEKFKSQQLSIGIISHVKELKERINCKILVEKATESCGSTLETII